MTKVLPLLYPAISIAFVVENVLTSLQWVEFFTSDAKVEDVMLSKHGYNDDYLTWTYQGKEYWAQGEFYVDDSNVLHHTFIAPNGKEIEIVCDYE